MLTMNGNTDGADIPLQDKTISPTDNLNNMNTPTSQGHHGYTPSSTTHNNIRYSSPAEPDDNISSSPHSHADRLLYKFRHRSLCMGVIVTIIFSLIACTLSIFAVTKYHEAARELRTARENRGKVCLPCDDQVIQLESWKQKNAAGDCCVQLEEVLYMMDQIAEEQARTQIKEAAEESSRLPVYSSGIPSGSIANSSHLQQRYSAHLVLERNSATNTAAIPWVNPSQSRLSHITEGLNIADKGRIKVSVSGYYFIYSQVSMIDGDILTNTGTPTVVHEISTEDVLDSTSNTKLMSSRNMVWKSHLKRDYSQQTSYLGGVFYIRSGAFVYVSVDDTEGRQPLKYCAPFECYFGLYKL